MDELKKQINEKIQTIIDYGGTEEDLRDLVEIALAPVHKIDRFIAQKSNIEINSKRDIGYCQCIDDLKRMMGYPEERKKC